MWSKTTFKWKWSKNEKGPSERADNDERDFVKLTVTGHIEGKMYSGKQLISPR